MVIMRCFLKALFGRLLSIDMVTQPVIFGPVAWPSFKLIPVSIDQEEDRALFFALVYLSDR